MMRGVKLPLSKGHLRNIENVLYSEVLFFITIHHRDLQKIPFPLISTVSYTPCRITLEDMSATVAWDGLETDARSILTTVSPFRARTEELVT